MRKLHSYIKSCEVGEVPKQSEVLEFPEIYEVINNPELASNYWLLRKTIVCLAYFGAHRTFELKALKFENLKSTQDGVVVTHYRAKQKGVKQVILSAKVL